MRKRPEISVSIFLLQAAQLKAGNRVREIHFDQQKALIVPKTDVVLRTEFLDQLAFKQKSLRLVSNKMHLKIPYAIEQSARLQICSHPTGRHKILGQPFSEIPVFADIDHPFKAVLHQIDARLMWNFA